MTSSEIRIVHAADIHLDSALRGLGRLSDDDLASRLRLATREAFDNLVDHCLRTQPDALILAGDLYDGDWRDYSTGLYFTDRMRDLDDARIPVVLVAGNHDAESVISRSLTLPPNVTRLRTDRPETTVFEDIGLAIHGQGFATKAVSANLAVAYPAPLPGLVNVGVLHTSVQGYANHDSYAPCSLAELTGRGYEYFALGHVHSRQVLAGGRATVAFSGNLQGRHPRELGPKGALEVTLTPGTEARLDFVALDVARWECLEVDVSDARDESEAFDLVDAAVGRTREQAGVRPVVARITLAGTNTLAGRLADATLVGHEIRPRAERHGVAVDQIRSQVAAPLDRRHMPATQRLTLQSVIAEMLADPEALRADASLKPDLDALVAEVSQYTRGVEPDISSAEQFSDLVAQACQRLVAQADAGML
jgi:DNA repair exonuclease SbcCD nuclease subunit